VSVALQGLMGKQKLPDRIPFSWNFYNPHLFANGPDALIKLVERDAARMRKDFGVELVAVYLDTMGLAAEYENDDKAAQVQKVLSGLHRLSDATGALAMGVDHMGKDANVGVRGSSAKRDNVETILTCLAERNGDGPATNHRMKLDKIRDGEEGRVIPYRLEVVDCGRDEDGDRIETCRIAWEPDRPPEEQSKRKRTNKMDSVMQNAIRDVGGLPADPFALRTAFYKRHGGHKHAANTAWLRAVKGHGLRENINGLLDEVW
jgi:hypothetical protein